MMLLPYDHYRIHTDVTPQDARDCLAAQVRAPSWARLFRPVWARRLRARWRSAGSRSSASLATAILLPVVLGTIRPAAAGSEIQITMRMQMPVIIFMLLWFGLLVVFRPSGASVNWRRTAEQEPAAPSTCSCSRRAYGMMTIGFQVEAAKARTFLRDLFANRALRSPRAAAPAAPPPSSLGALRAPGSAERPSPSKYGAGPREDEDASSSRPRRPAASSAARRAVAGRGPRRGG